MAPTKENKTRLVGKNQSKELTLGNVFFITGNLIKKWGENLI
jgi:hypothetical protein